MFYLITFFLVAIMIGCSSFPMKYHWRRIQSSSSRWIVTRKALQEKFSIEQRVVALMEKINIPSTSTLLLSVSGGSDSMAMLHILRSIQNHYLKDLSLKVVNFNHKARKESDEEVRENPTYRSCSCLYIRPNVRQNLFESGVISTT